MDSTKEEQFKEGREERLQRDTRNPSGATLGASYGNPFSSIPPKS
jgi:hypothetical protein